MADKKNHHESLNVEEALSVSEAFIVKHKTAIIGFVAGVIILVAGALAYKHLYAEPREEKLKPLFSRVRSILSRMLMIWH